MIFDEYLWNLNSKIISTIVPCNICFSIKAYNPKKALRNGDILIVELNQDVAM